MSKTFLFQAIQFSQTVPIQTIQFSVSTFSMLKTIQLSISTQFSCQKSFISSNSISISMQFNYIWPIDRILSGPTTLGQSRPRSDGNERVLRISQSSSITGASQSDCLMSYPGHSFGGGLTPLQRYSRCILQLQPTGHRKIKGYIPFPRVLVQNWT